MDSMIIVYVPCANTDEVKKIGTHIMKARLAPCYNILGSMQSAAFWPPKTGEIEEINGAVLLIKSVASKYPAIENEIKSLHSDSNPCIFSIKVDSVAKEYFEWLQSEIGK